MYSFVWLSVVRPCSDRWQQLYHDDTAEALCDCHLVDKKAEAAKLDFEVKRVCKLMLVMTDVSKILTYT